MTSESWDCSPARVMSIMNGVQVQTRVITIAAMGATLTHTGCGASKPKVSPSHARMPLNMPYSGL